MQLHNVTFDTHDASALASFWSKVLERPILEGANEQWAMIPRIPTAPAFLFLQVPEGKVAKNRVHLDFDVDDTSATRAQLEALGATFVHEKDEWGVHWFTFRDPDGNEFCIASHAESGT